MSQTPSPSFTSRDCRSALLGAAVVFVPLYFGGCLNPRPPAPPDKPWGEFVGMPESKWLIDGRDMQLLKDFTYVDSRKKVWTAPAGSIINGATIPQAFWSIVGGPLEGKYRNASIIHDTECDRRGEPSEAVHYMFYEACRGGGLDEEKAKLMYWAVRWFGPSWKFAYQTLRKKVTLSDGRIVEVVETPRVAVEDKKASVPTPDLVELATRYVKEKNPSTEELEGLSPEALKVGALPQ